MPEEHGTRPSRRDVISRVQGDSDSDSGRAVRAGHGVARGVLQAAQALV